MSEFFKYILPIGVIFTFIGTMMTVFYTRKNIKMTKYIDTITSERIKWIENLRNNLSTLLSWLIVYASNIDRLNLFSEIFDELENQELSENPYGDEVSSSYIVREMIENKKNKESILKELEEITKEKLIEKIYLIKLSLNSKSDSKMVNLLDILLDVFVLNIKETERSFNSIIKEFVEISQLILKAEWEKVKSETKNGN